MRQKRPSAPMVLSIIAVVFSLAGTGAASVATISALSKKEKTQTKRIADNEVNRLAPFLSVKSAGTAGSANTAGNASQLGGIGAGGFVQGSGRQVPVRAYLNNNDADVVLIDASGVGKLTAGCFNSGQDVQLAYTDTSGAQQVASGSVVNNGATSTAKVDGFGLNNNTGVSETGSTAGNSEAHVFTFDAAPFTATGASGFSFRGTGWTKVGADPRCVVTGVATIG